MSGKQYRAVCPYDCADACGMLVTVEDGRITRVSGDPEHPVTRGFLCRKMQHYEEDVCSRDRILTPYRRVGVKGKKTSFEPVSWEEAVREICTRWKEIIRRYGADTIVPYSFAGTMGLIQRNCGEAFFNRLGGAILDRTVCGAGRTAAMQLVSGCHTDLPLERITECDLILLYSDNPKVTRIHAVPFLQQARKNGARIVMVDVYANLSADLCDEVILVRPGTDSALLLAVMNQLEQMDLLDQAFIREHAVQFEKLRGEYICWTPERASAVCGVPPETIRDLARSYGQAACPVIASGYGFSRYLHAGSAAALLEDLPVLTGAWKHDGGIAGNVGSMDLADKTEIKRPDLAQTADRRVINMNELGKWLPDPEGPIRSLYVYHSNPAVMAPDQQRVLQGLAREDLFLIVHDRFFTDTAVFADIILPAVFSVEQTDIYCSFGYYHVQTGRKILEPPGECRSNWNTFRALAEEMGFSDPYFDVSEEAFADRLLDSGRLWGDMLDTERVDTLRRGYAVMITPPPATLIPTEDGRYHLAPREMGYREPEKGKYPLRLVMSHSPWSLNSNFSYNGKLMTARGGPTLRMHPEDAEERGLKDGDMARARNDHGSIQVKIRVISGILKGTVNAEGVFQKNWCYGGGNFSSLTEAAVSDSGNGALHNNSTVEVERL